MKKEEIEQLLARKFQKESARLKSWGTKTDDKAALSFAMCVSEFVRSLMADSRYRELKRILKKYDVRLNEHSGQLKIFYKYVQERMKATKQMAAAIKKFAEDKESKRAWKSKERHEERQHHKSSRRVHEERTHEEKKSKHENGSDRAGHSRSTMESKSRHKKDKSHHRKHQRRHHRLHS